VTATEDNTEQPDLSKGHSEIITADLTIADIPEDSLPLAGGIDDYPFTIAHNNKVFISKSSRHPELTLGADVIFADKNQHLMSRKTGESVSFSDRPRSLRSDDGEMIGEIQSPLTLNVTNSNTETSNDSQSHKEVAVQMGDTTTTVRHSEKETVEETITVQYQNESRAYAEFETKAQLTVENLGRRVVVAHPDNRIVPANHRLARSAQKIHNEQSTNGMQVGTEHVQVHFSRQYGAFVVNQTHIGMGGGA
jgi:hypothetical protein